METVANSDMADVAMLAAARAERPISVATIHRSRHAFRTAAATSRKLMAI
jgi:hypothetical protein